MDPFTIFAVASAVFGGASVIQGQQAAKSASKAQAAQRDMANMRAAKERMSAIRDMRIAYASAQNRAELGGVAESSGAAGGQGSIHTQGMSNIHFLDGQKTAADQAGMWLDKAAKQESTAKMFSGLSSLAMSGANFFGMPPNPASTVQDPMRNAPGFQTSVLKRTTQEAFIPSASAMIGSMPKFVPGI